MIRSLQAAAFGCGLFLAAAAWAQESPQAPGPMAAASVRKVLLLDGVRLGERTIAVGDRGYILLTDDQGAHWRRAQAPAVPMLTAVRFRDDKVGWAVGHDSVILATADGGETWKSLAANPPEQLPLLDCLFVDDKRGIVVGAYGTYFETADGGQTWKDRKIISDDKHYNAILKLKDGRLMILGEAGTLLVSADAGGSWTPLASPYKGSFFGGVVAGDGSIVAFGLRGHIYRSADGGRSWAPVANASQASLMGGSRLADGAIVLAGAAGTALVSRDNGQSFQPITTQSTRAFSKAVPAGHDKVLLLGETGATFMPLPSMK